MTISIKEVETIAELAKLMLTNEEKVMFQGQLSSILNFAETIQQVDTAGIPPTTGAIAMSKANNVTRSDEVAASLSNEEALSNAPQSEAGSFKVQAVLE